MGRNFKIQKSKKFRKKNAYSKKVGVFVLIDDFLTNKFETEWVCWRLSIAGFDCIDYRKNNGYNS